MRFVTKRFSLFDRLIGLIETKKTSDRFLLRGLFFLAIFSGLFAIYNYSQDQASPSPARGGVLTEGIVGIPRFVNPVLATTRADLDATALIYSGLLRINPDGELVPDLAESITTSEDGKVYTIIMRKDRTFHDGTPITARDVAYTYGLIQNPDLKSPLRGNWSDVSLEEVSEYELRVSLTDAYSPFNENFTVGIIPRHIWSNMPIEQLPFSQHNTEPIGSGPFQIKDVRRDASGLISGYSLIPFNSGRTPNLAGIELQFFQNENTLIKSFEAGDITATAYLPNNQLKNLATDSYRVISEPLPRVFGIFFNQNRSTALRDKAAREALSASLNREEIIGSILFGYGVPITKPILEEAAELQSGSTTSTSSPKDIATNILKNGGWKQNDAGFWEKKIGEATETLSLTIKTANSELFNQTATIVAETWRGIGVEVQVEQYEQADLVQSVIRTRDFQGLLFGIDMNRSQDLYPFWHSSQKDDPGLNVAQYTNISVDRLLEKTRNTQDKTERQNLLSEISTSISAETPAVLLFAPSMTYVIKSDVVTTPLNELGKPADRFMNVSDWYAKTEILWPFFQNNEIVN